MGCCNSKVDKPSKKKAENLKSLGEPLKVAAISAEKPKLVIQKGKVGEKYKIIKLLGTEKHGSYFQVMNVKTNVERFLKEYIKAKTSKKTLEQVLESIETLYGIDHPNVVKITEVIESDESLNIIAELCTGGELTAKISKNKSFSEKDAAKTFKDIMLAISCCHANGIVHRNISTKTILYQNQESNSEIKLVDFSLSKKMKHKHALKEPIGSVQYMAPEVFDKEYNEKCDIWSAGVVLYIMLVGRPPFGGHKVNDIVASIKEGKLHLDKSHCQHLSGEAKDLLKKMLSVDPEARLSAQQVLEHQWIKSYNNDTISSIPLTEEVFAHLIRHHSESKLSDALFSFVATQISDSAEDKILEEQFKAMDKNGDGRLTLEEIESGLKLLSPGTNVDPKKLFSEIDRDHSGFVGYTEFMMASRNWKKTVQKEELEKVFQSLDIGSDGQLALNDFKNSFPGIDSSEWADFFKAADANQDGLISYEELKEYLISRA
ncbi:CDPK1_18 [Blepharisma stoltei]|uniref:Calcium-dependent protein kinase n=1 Tax=Blepharisma stoltei TaxID=1481888 RepID=A0AAU9IWP4_9CILI|nr:unnamed protein product [Blepharisma stoltei]